MLCKREESGRKEASRGVFKLVFMMDKKSELVKLSYLLPGSRTYVSADGTEKSVNGSKNPKKINEAQEIETLEKRVARLQSIHYRLDAIIAELEEYLNK